MKGDNEALSIAFMARRDIAQRSDIYRLVDDGDGFPGLVCDLYGKVARVERYQQGAEARSLIAGLRRRGYAIALWERTPRGARLLEADAAVPRGHVVHEHGARYLVRVREEKAVGTGIFADHRGGRALVRKNARGKRILNLFSHAGAFGVAAATGGAVRVDQVDAAKKCAPWMATNLALNGVDPRQHRIIVDDAFHYLAKYARRAPTYDGIIIDPPTTAMGRGNKRFVLRERIDELVSNAKRCLRPDGFLLFSCNDRSISVADLRRSLGGGAAVLPGDDYSTASMRGVFVSV